MLMEAFEGKTASHARRGTVRGMVWSRTFAAGLVMLACKARFAGAVSVAAVQCMQCICCMRARLCDGTGRVGSVPQSGSRRLQSSQSMLVEQHWWRCNVQYMHAFMHAWRVTWSISPEQAAGPMCRAGHDVAAWPNRVCTKWFACFH